MHVNMVVTCPYRRSPFRVQLIVNWWGARKCDCCDKLWWILTDGEKYKIRRSRPVHLDDTPNTEPWEPATLPGIGAVS